jgi:hypothetical protein
MCPNASTLPVPDRTSQGTPNSAVARVQGSPLPTSPCPLLPVGWSIAPPRSSTKNDSSFYSTSSVCGLSAPSTPSKSRSAGTTPEDAAIDPCSAFLARPLLPLQPVALAAFKPDGFEDTLSLVLEDLSLVSASPLASVSPQWN